jgi:hypothetical protein
MEEKLKHLEIIQNVINRMAGNSFRLKGWSVTLTAAIFALAAKDGNANLIPVAYFPVLIFWFLDAYFLHQEGLYRKLYDTVRVKDRSQIDFSMDTTPFQGDVAPYLKVMFSITLRCFHGALLLSVIIVNLITWRN